MKVYGIIDEHGNEADEYAYVNIGEAEIAADGYAKETGKTFLVKELGEVV